MQTLGHLNSCSQSIDAWMEKPLSTGCENTLLNTDFTSVTSVIGPHTDQETGH